MSMRILVVEDEAVTGMTIESMLQQSGYTVTGVAMRGEEALSMFRDTPADLVLMDIALPGDMNGIEAALAIRRISDVPIIFVTAHSSDDYLQPAKQAEPAGYVLKPFSRDSLVSTIEVAAYKHQADRRIKAMLNGMVDAVSSLIAVKDSRLASLGALVASLSLAIARDLGLSVAEQDAIGPGSKLHTAGLFFVPDQVLVKLNVDDALIDAEQGMYREYPRRTLQVFGAVGFPDLVADIILHARERLDGSGFPDGLAGEALTPVVRICSVVMEFCTRMRWKGALLDRPARKALADQLLQELTADSGRLWDDKVLAALERQLRDGVYNAACFELAAPAPG